MSFIAQALLVGCGGFIGSVLRYVVSSLVQRRFPVSEFPYGILSVNVLGCLLIGIIGGFLVVRSSVDPMYRLFLMAGVLGGFTTYSSFAWDSLVLAQNGQMLSAGLNTVLHVVLGFSAAWLGFMLARTLWQ